jgi:hypothetical protein
MTVMSSMHLRCGGTTLQGQPDDQEAACSIQSSATRAENFLPHHVCHLP